MKNNAELAAKVKDAIAEHVAPALELDGSGIELLEFADGIARVRLTGACSGCPATIVPLIMGLEGELRKYVPEVEFVEAVS